MRSGALRRVRQQAALIVQGRTRPNAFCAVLGPVLELRLLRRAQVLLDSPDDGLAGPVVRQPGERGLLHAPQVLRRATFNGLNVTLQGKAFRWTTCSYYIIAKYIKKVNIHVQ